MRLLVSNWATPDVQPGDIINRTLRRKPYATTHSGMA
jgi:hypothetical protein